MREIWKYKWNAQVDAALIEVSVYGATIEEAAVSLVKEELKKELGAKESALDCLHLPLQSHLEDPGQQQGALFGPQLLSGS